MYFVEHKYKRVIIWGAGSIFQRTQKWLPIDYIIDNDKTKWGERFIGYNVVSPEELRSENPTETLIVVFAPAIKEIQAQIKEYGDFQVISYIDYFWGLELVKEIFFEDEFVKTKLSSGKIESAIMIQGNITAFTKYAIKNYAYNNPDQYIILSTWEGEKENIQKYKIDQYADKIIYNKLPDFSGAGNRNYQIVTTEAGLEYALDVGIKKILKSRSDMVASKKNLIDSFVFNQNKYADLFNKKYDLKNRIVVAQVFTRKYIMYHPSDMIMFGDTQDLYKYWNIKLDNRDIDLNFNKLSNISFKNLSQQKVVAETYFGIEFCKTIGWECKFNLKDSWQWFKEIFAIVDNSDFHMYWYKNPIYLEVLEQEPYLECISSQFWEFICNNDKALEYLAAGNILDYKINYSN